MLSYPVRLIPGEKGLVLVTFPDLPEAVSCGEGEEDAIARAGEMLDIVLACYRAEGRPIPRPSDIGGVPTVSSDRFGRNILPSGPPQARRTFAKAGRGRTEPRASLIFV